jgi:hypothetical protein
MLKSYLILSYILLHRDSGPKKILEDKTNSHGSHACTSASRRPDPRWPRRRQHFRHPFFLDMVWPAAKARTEACNHVAPQPVMPSSSPEFGSPSAIYGCVFKMHGRYPSSRNIFSSSRRLTVVPGGLYCQPGSWTIFLIVCPLSLLPLSLLSFCKTPEHTYLI